MRIEIKFCDNCGTEYRYQSSGNYCLDTPIEYNNDKHCPECRKIVIDSLSKIPKKTELRYIKCDDFTIEEIIKYKDEEIKSQDKLLFPKLTRVYAKLYNLQDVNDPINFYHTSDIKINRINYCYTYNYKTMELIKLSKEVRWDLINDCFYEEIELR